MSAEEIERRIAVVMAADVEGYGRLMGEDEVATLRSLAACRVAMDEIIDRARGRVANTAGDSVLAEFPSVADAVLSALEIQEALAAEQRAVAPDERIRFRIGINAGDVLARGSDLFGDGVNIAARIQAMTPPDGVAVSRTVRDHARGRIPVTFEDLGFHVAKNIERPLRIFVVRRGGVGVRPGPKLGMPDKPSIAVLPFEILGAEPGHEHLGDGIVEEITAALSRIRSFFVIARSSTLAYRGRATPPPQIGRELGVRYLIEGSVRHAGDRVRITTQLIEAINGTPLWAERFEGRSAEVFDLQDRITEAVAGAIQPSVLTAEIERARRKRPDNLLAYDYVMQALPLVWPVGRSQNEAARVLLSHALELDPDYPLALSLLAWCHAQAAAYNWSDEPGTERQAAVRLAERAAGLSQDEPMVLAVLGAAHTVSKNFETAAAHLERAVAIDPNSSWGWHRLAWLHVNQDRADAAILCFERSMRLSPLDPMGYVAGIGIGVAHFTAGRPMEAVQWMRRGVSRQPEAIWAYRYLAPALVQCNRMDEAREALDKLRLAHPSLTLRKIREALIFTPRTLDLMIEGLRQVGLPE